MQADELDIGFYAEAAELSGARVKWGTQVTTHQLTDSTFILIDLQS
jgi:hypothetical protein